MPELSAPHRRPWLGTFAVAGCVAVELAIASAPLGVRQRAAALLALAALAVGLALRQAMGALASRALRLAVVGPVIFSLVLAVVLALDAWARGEALLR